MTVGLLFFKLFFCCAERNIDPGAADDPNELPFKKGEHLEIIDKSGKWWEARTSAGRKGSMYSFVFLFFPFCPFLMKTDIFFTVAPSNYLQLLI